MWDTDCIMGIWTDWSAGADVSDIYVDTGEGPESWKYEGTGAWMGIGIRVDPYNDTYLRDLSPYDYLNFMHKGTKGFKVGMKQATGTGGEIWMNNAQLATYIVVGSGDLLDGTWHTIQIPFSLFGIDFAQIAQYFMFVSDAALGYTVGDAHYIDHVYYSAD